MKRYIALLIITTVAVCCQSKKTKPETTADTPLEGTATDSLVAAGWTKLFDGSMNGWTMYRGMENDSWEVVDGTLHCKSFDSAQVRSDIRTNERYSDFELTFDWRVAPAANSGVMYRVDEEAKEPFFSGPEYQLIDDTGYPGELEDWQLTGACYAMYAAPSSKKLNPAGEWNTTRIVAKGNHIEHWLNGDKLFEYELNSPGWKKLKDAGKWKDESAYGQSANGYIVLQDHKNEAWFKNIYIKNL